VGASRRIEVRAAEVVPLWSVAFAPRVWRPCRGCRAAMECDSPSALPARFGLFAPFHPNPQRGGRRRERRAAGRRGSTSSPRTVGVGRHRERRAAGRRGSTSSPRTVGGGRHRERRAAGRRGSTSSPRRLGSAAAGSVVRRGDVVRQAHHERLGRPPSGASCGGATWFDKLTTNGVGPGTAGARLTNPRLAARGFA
jgi:hypothetical protein